MRSDEVSRAGQSSLWRKALLTPTPCRHVSRHRVRTANTARAYRDGGSLSMGAGCTGYAVPAPRSPPASPTPHDSAGGGLARTRAAVGRNRGGRSLAVPTAQGRDEPRSARNLGMGLGAHAGLAALPRQCARRPNSARRPEHRLPAQRARPARGEVAYPPGAPLSLAVGYAVGAAGGSGYGQP